MPPASDVPSRPSARRSMSAPVSWVVSALAASASAAARRSALSSATHLPPERMSGRASLASSRISAAVSSTSSNTADQLTLASWLAPTAVSFDSANRRRLGVALRVESSGTRTSKPASARRGPVTVMSSHASSWLRMVWPRRSVPARSSAGSMRSRRLTSWSRSERLERSSTMARSTGTSTLPPPPLPLPFPLVAARGLATNTSRSHTPVRSGGSRRTISARVFARDRPRPLLGARHELAGDARGARRTRCRRGGRGTLR